MMAVPSSSKAFGLIPWYSLLIVIGAGLAIWLASREERIAGLPKDTVIDLSFWAIPFGILGARIYYVLFSWNQFRDRPLSVLYIWEGGIAIYGAVIAGVLVVWLFSRARRLSFFRICDVIAPGLVLAQAIGRWGNYFNMEAYGEIVTDPALQFFPFAVLIQEDGRPVWHMAAFFYESLWNVCVFLFLIIGRRRLFRRTGDVWNFYLFLYAAGRLIIEDFRMDSLYAAGSIRISQLLALLLNGLIWHGWFRRPDSCRGMSKTVRILLCCLHTACLIPVLVYALNLPILPSLSLGGRALLLGSYSLVSIASALLIYGKSTPEEVVYAVRSH